VHCSIKEESEFMADETKVQAEAAVEAPARVAEAIADTTEKVVKASAAVAKRERAASTRRVTRKAAAQRTVTRRTAKKPRRTVRKAARKTAAAQKRIETMTTTNFFAGLDNVPAFAPFQTLFAEFGERSQDVVKRSQKVAEELADLTRANVEALVESGRVAAEGARSIGQDVVAKSRENVEQTADVIRTLAEAKSPTEYLQLQSDFARASFDRLVSESSKLTESMVKLAGQTFQPLTNRATANAERFNTLVA
jgi:phasin family protein